MIFTPGYSEKINEKFSVGIANIDKEDHEKILELNTEVHGKSIKKFIDRLFFECPKKDELLWFYVKENQSGRLISGLTLMPLSVISIDTILF